MDFAADLSKFGPVGYSPLSLADAERYVWRFTTSRQENFPVLTAFVPRSLRRDFASVYAYCRWSDDLADEVDDPARALELLDWWEGELEALYAGRPRHPVMVALAPTVDRHSLPKDDFADLLVAFRRDQEQRRYESVADVLDYCRYSAHPVGRLVLRLCDQFSDERAELSDAVCAGLQLANFLQDVSDDLRRNRVYLPAEEMARFGVSEADLLAGRETDGYRALMASEASRAEGLLRAGLPLASAMRGRLRVAVALFAQGGLAILRRIAIENYATLRRRPRLSRWDKASALARGLATAAGLGVNASPTTIAGKGRAPACST